ncbi:hypothetical protein [Actinoplanes sp. N902-109]|uniref:hypothetical protein n=1 Tax=Actinoplanes sp. (strain N902-109) TaxID=649831 RepID=UPI0003294B0D|nr:hypothetical protein [Actinoplanes sp. N902-109]AGL14873.1 hypothetical protein L083_1363 [Actinoplanes sp. N902-109]
MERGPLALFGAIVAIGLGPAMWLGAQFGESTLTPQRPPAVTVQQNEVIPPGNGGAGAGDTPTGPADLIRTDPQVRTAPHRSKPTTAPTTPPTSEAPSPPYEEETTAPVDEPASAEPPSDDATTEPDDPGTTPSDPTDGPTDDPTDEPTDEPTEPEVPTTDVTTSDEVTAGYGA